MTDIIILVRNGLTVLMMELERGGDEIVFKRDIVKVHGNTIWVFGLCEGLDFGFSGPRSSVESSFD